MQVTSRNFKQNAHEALHDVGLQSALSKMRQGFQKRRADVIERLPEFDRLRDDARVLKDDVLANLDVYLEQYEERASANGAQIHWAPTAADACEAITRICRDAGAHTVTKGKSMITEEIGLNDHLKREGLVPIETDLGEYIIQLRGEAPSHIIGPAVHLGKEQVAGTFRSHHKTLNPDRSLEEASSLIGEAREVLRHRFGEALVGVTGANFLIAESGTSVIVTNEGNGDLTQTLADVHIVVASIDKVVPTLEDVSTIMRILARSATGQEITSYTTFSTGPRRDGDADGPREYHVILLDNGRSSLLGGEFQDVLRCIRCGACMNHCPIYGSVGGHSYGWVYPGPIGAVLNPGLVGVADTGHLPNASTFCGRCEEVCPMRIPLPKMMRHWREQEFEQKLSPTTVRGGLRSWAWVARRPRLYRLGARLATRVLKLAGRGAGRVKRFPLAGGWTEFRDLPLPQGGTFHEQWARHRKAGGADRGQSGGEKR